jgi:hypothetical protein
MKKFTVLFFVVALLVQGCVSVNVKQSETGRSQSTVDNMKRNTTAVAGGGMSAINGGESWSPLFGFMLGLETSVYQFSALSSFRVALLLSLQGAAYTETNGIEPYMINPYLKSGQAISFEEFSGKVSLTYLYLPLLYHFNSNNGFYFEAGLQPGFLLGAQDKPDGASGYDYKDYIKKFELAIPLGAGYQFNDQLSIGGRAVFGLTNINTDGTDFYSSNDTDRNFMLLAVLKYRLSK